MRTTRFVPPANSNAIEHCAKVSEGEKEPNKLIGDGFYLRTSWQDAQGVRVVVDVSERASELHVLDAAVKSHQRHRSAE